MNKQRRKELKDVIDTINEMKSKINYLASEEEMAFDNLSEGLQQSWMGEELEENAEYLFESIDKIDELLEYLYSVA